MGSHQIMFRNRNQTVLRKRLIVFVNDLEREDGPMVVDVPAGMFDYSEASDVAPVGDAELPLANEKDVERVEPTLDSVETDEKKPDTDDLGFRIPTIFVIRRPVLSDRFPFFQQSPFQSFRPFSFLGNRRPSVERPVVEDVADDENTHDMLSHMERMSTSLSID